MMDTWEEYERFVSMRGRTKAEFVAIMKAYPEFYPELDANDYDGAMFICAKKIKEYEKWKNKNSKT